MDFYTAICRRPLINFVPESCPEDKPSAIATIARNSNEITLYSWRNEWLLNMANNLKVFGYFSRNHSVKVFFNECIEKDLIIVGAGPGLESNLKYLELAKSKGFKIFASSHATLYMSKMGIMPDYVAHLDAGGQWDDYLKNECNRSDIPLMADIVCNTRQLQQWKGELYFYRSHIPTEKEGCVVGEYVDMEMNRIMVGKDYPSTIPVGGHVVGAMVSIANAILNARNFIFIGCDYCFYGDKHYPYNLDIDKPSIPIGNQMMVYDIFGNKVVCNSAYYSFKLVMDSTALFIKQTSPQKQFINATEQGIMGAKQNGNLDIMKYLRLEDAVYMLTYQPN